MSTFTHIYCTFLQCHIFPDIQCEIICLIADTKTFGLMAVILEFLINYKFRQKGEVSKLHKKKSCTKYFQAHPE